MGSWLRHSPVSGGCAQRVDNFGDIGPATQGEVNNRTNTRFLPSCRA